MKFLVVLILTIIIGSEGSDDPMQSYNFQTTWDFSKCLYLGHKGLLGGVLNIVDGLLNVLAFGQCSINNPAVLWSPDTLPTGTNVVFSITFKDPNGVSVCPSPPNSLVVASCNDANSMWQTSYINNGWYTLKNQQLCLTSNPDGVYGAACTDAFSNQQWKFLHGSYYESSVTAIMNKNGETLSMSERKLCTTA